MTQSPADTRPVAPQHAIDAERLGAWLAANVAPLDGPLEIAQFKGGQSNPTYLLAAGNQRYVLRRKPPGKLLQSAHAVDREFKVIKSLAGTGVPVARAQALADTLLLHVSKHVVVHGIENDPGFARRMLAGLSRRVHGLMADVESYSMQSGSQRVIGYLLRQDADGNEGESAYTVLLPTSKSIVASRLNLTPEHFSRILHELVDGGLVTVEGREVRILDAQKLRSHTG